MGSEFQPGVAGPRPPPVRCQGYRNTLEAAFPGSGTGCVMAQLCGLGHTFLICEMGPLLAITVGWRPVKQHATGTEEVPGKD